MRDLASLCGIKSESAPSIATLLIVTFVTIPVCVRDLECSKSYPNHGPPKLSQEELIGTEAHSNNIPLDVAMAFAGLTTEQLDSLCAANSTLRAALESWIVEGGPYAWNEWQRGFH